MIPDWVLFVASVVVPIGGLVLALDSRASNRRRDMHNKIDELRAANDKHNRETFQAIAKIDKRLAVVESRSFRIRKGD